ncbi:hypothetical protein GmHk_17G049125 [Glycine max]|nr:hypothetical protein GmHk_17G049125 [Glycine max]
MARLTHFVLLFVLLFLSHELLGSEGRNLRQITIQSPDATKAMSIATKSANAIPSYRSIRSLSGDVEAFRPTTPGHIVMKQRNLYIVGKCSKCDRNCSHDMIAEY